MEEKSRRIVTLACLFLCISFAVLGAWLFFKYILGVLLPFAVGLCLALSVRRPAEQLSHGTRIPPRILRLVLVVLVFCALGAVLWLAGARLTREIQELFFRLSNGEDLSLPPAVEQLLSRLPQAQSGGLQGYIDTLIDSTITTLTGKVPALIGSLVSAMPPLFLAVLMTLLSALYFCLDLERVGPAVRRLLPTRAQEWLTRIKNGALRLGLGYLRAYLVLTAITFCLLLVGFLLLGVDYALLLAFLVCLVDLLPVLGVGTVLAPWGAWLLLSGSVGRGVGLLVLWVICLSVRQIAEPRLLGGHLGIHPLVTLLAMYGGFRLGGVLGMLLAPALCVPLQQLLKLYTSKKTSDGASPPPSASTT